jgi:hypothetical protein
LAIWIAICPALPVAPKISTRFPASKLTRLLSASHEDIAGIIAAAIVTGSTMSGSAVSHGEPTFFVHNKVFVMFANNHNHHNDGHIAVWLPVPPGVQSGLIESAPSIFFKPPYVGVRGWIGIELDRISDEDLSFHIHVAWELIAPKRLLAQAGATADSSKPSRKRGAE